ncbi:hypothetical protein MD484_g8448, partial [Candolleomyces efflorescens]
MVFGFFSRKSTVPAVQVAGSTSTQDPSSSSSGSTPAAPSLGGDFKFPRDGLHTPAPSISISHQLNVNAAVATPPPPTPSPPPPDLEPEPPKRELVTDPRALYTLITSVPPQTLHTYCLQHLNPANFPSASPSPKRRKGKGRVPPGDVTQPAHRRSQSIGGGKGETDEEGAITPETLTQLTSFFKSLVPPPQLHCVRCHKSYFELDNTDMSCRVPHDDDSAIVDRVGVSIPSASSSHGKGRSGEAATYETLWGCCGKVVEGDGDQGPPDGWCYEGRHTVDTKRARWRADSSLHDDKLQSCAKRRCFVNSYSRPPVSQSTNASGSTNANVGRRSTRKRTMSKAVLEDQEMGDADEKDADDDRKSTISGTGSVAKRRRKTRKIVSPAEVQDDDDDDNDDNDEKEKEDGMDVDQEDGSAPAPRSPPASPRRVSRPTARSLASAAQARARSSSRKPRSKLGTSGDGNALPPVPTPSISSSSFPGDGLATARGRTTANAAYVEINRVSKSRSPTRPAAATGKVSELKKKFSVASLKVQAQGGVDSDTDTVASDSRVTVSGKRSATRVKRRVTAKKALEEVVDSSVVGEVEMRG